MIRRGAPPVSARDLRERESAQEALSVLRRHPSALDGMLAAPRRRATAAELAHLAGLRTTG